MTEQNDVLVIGAGPTGLALAITLRRYGISVRVIDKAEHPATVSKALAIWSASLEAMQGMGVIDDFLAAGKRLHALCAGDGSRQLARIAVGDGIDSPFPFPLLLPQFETEKLLTARLSALGVTIERGVELTEFVQDGSGVTAMLKHADGRMEETRASYLVGCDGARSAVRHGLGIEFEGYTEPQTFLLVDARIEGGDLDHDNIYIWWNRGGSIALFPFAGETWRMFAIRREESDEAPNIEEMQQHAERFGPPGIRLYDPSWLSTFRINERLAERYRVGRCFLAGDAAHIHSPAGGQGMNTGLQDATNLGWKLAYAIQEIGDAELLLDSYEPERRPVAREVIKGSAQKLHVAFNDNPAVRILKDIAVTVFGNLTAVQKMLQTQLSETEIIYTKGPLVALGEPPHSPRRTDVGTRARDVLVADGVAGEHALWPLISGRHHTLLVFDAKSSVSMEAAQAGTEDRLSVVHIPPERDPGGKARSRFNLGDGGWVLIRPDQVVAVRGDASDLAPLYGYLRRVVWRQEV